MPASDLYDACMALLTDAVDALATTAAGAPPIALPYPGPPIDDYCNMVTVHWTPIVHTPNSPPGAASLDAFHRNYAYLNLVTFTITVRRCDAAIPDGATHPGATDIAAAAKVVADDAWALNHVLMAKIREGTLFGPFPCNEVQMGQIQQLSPLGGIIGCTLAITAEIQGYA